MTKIVDEDAKMAKKREDEANAAIKRACIITEGRSQPWCSLCNIEIKGSTSIKSHLKSKPHKELLKKFQGDAAGGDEAHKATKQKTNASKDLEQLDAESNDSDSEKTKKKKEKSKKRESIESASDGSDTEQKHKNNRHSKEENEDEKREKTRKRRESSDPNTDDHTPSSKKKKNADGKAEGADKSPKKKTAYENLPTGCLAVNVSGIADSASHKSQGKLRKLFPKATKVVYGAPGKARVCFLETADVRDALSVDGEVLDGSRLLVKAEHPEEVALEADKAAAGHEVFLKWLPPIATEEGLSSIFSTCGEIMGDVRLRRSPQDGSCMGIGWITFMTAQGAKNALLKSGTRYPGGPPGRGINVSPATVTLATTAARERGSLQAAGTHTPAMCEETLRVMVLPDPDGIYVDGTFGRGGHSRAILSRLSSKGRLHAFDLDPEAIEVGRQLQGEDSRFTIHHKPFGHMAKVLKREGVQGKVSGVFLDLGISSPQFDSSNRGFRPEMDGPLDLRFDLTRGMSAYDLLKTVDRLELRRILIENGETDEVAARRIADAVAVAVETDSLPDRTREFADMVMRAKGKEYQAMHPSKLTFQSLRVHINQEFQEIRRGISAAFDVLQTGGRCGLLTWKHSECAVLMDCYRNYEIIQPNAPMLLYLQDQYPKTAKKLQEREAFDMDDVRRPTANEVRENSRARSVLLHVMRKKIGVRALDVERAAYRKLGWEDAPEEPSVTPWRGW